VDNSLFGKEKALNEAEIWEGIVSAVRAQLKPETFDRWFGPCVVKNGLPAHLTVEAPNVFHRNWILEHYGPFIQDTLQQLAGPEVTLIIQTPGEPESPASPAKPPRRRRKTKPPAVRRISENNGSKLNAKYTFENFVEGSCNRFARTASLAAAETPGRAYNPLFIYGGVGLGKTHLMQAIGHHMLSHHKGVRIHYISSEAFTNHLVRSLQTRSMEAFRRRYRDTDALLIDDIQFFCGKDRTQEEFFHTFNVLFDLRSQIVLSSDRPPADLDDIKERLRSRFQSGLVVDLQVPDVETRAVILLKHATYSQIDLPEGVAFFIAEKVKSNIRQLEGALLQVASYARMMRRPLTRGLAEQVLQDTLKCQRPCRVTIDAIQKKAAEHFDIRVADMKSSRRPKTIAFPRQIAMYLCRELTTHSLQEIGEAFGGRNHATVIHAIKLIKKKLLSDSDLALLIQELKQALLAD
jgi:chromosomal replication initiator protein